MKLAVILFCCCFVNTCFSQQNNSISAFVKDSLTKEPVLFASITNINTQKTVLSDDKGAFNIIAKENDLLSIASISYSFDTIRVTGKLLQSPPSVFLLHPLTKNLEQVTVRAKHRLSRYQSDSILRRKDFFQTITDYVLPVASIANSGAGIGINLDHFYGPEKRKRKAIGLFEQMEKEHYINYRFNPVALNKYTKLSRDSLLLFMQRYRPDYTWLRKHTADDDILYYINDKLKLFFKEKKN